MLAEELPLLKSSVEILEKLISPCRSCSVYLVTPLGSWMFIGRKTEFQSNMRVINCFDYNCQLWDKKIALGVGI